MLDVTFDQRVGKDGLDELGGRLTGPSARRKGLLPQRRHRLGRPPGIRVGFAGEGEWKITIDAFRDLGLAFAAAMLMIYVILVAQTNSFVVPDGRDAGDPADGAGRDAGLLAAQPGLSGQTVGGFTADPVFFTATAMIGMIALADRHPTDRPGRLHPPVGGEGPVAVRRHHGEPRRPAPADPPTASAAMLRAS
ncbi:MAG: hypothetical protein U0790_05355 [Isosphaeraceae bacterium]